MKNWFAVIVFSMVALFTQQVSAVESPFETSIATGMDNAAADSIYILPKVTNRGGSPLTNILLFAYVDGKQVSTQEMKPRLEPGEQLVSKKLTTKVSYKKPGVYPIILYTAYKDAANIQRAVPVVSFVSYKSNNPATALVAKMPDITVAGNGVLDVTVENKGSKEVRGRVLALIPTEFVVTSTEKAFTLKAGAEETFSFEFKNYNAPAGSSHTAYAVIEGEDDTAHYANGANSRIRFDASASAQTPAGEKAGSGTTTIIIVIVLLALAGSAFIILRKTGGTENR